MNTLFAIETVFPEGFSYYPDFITKEEEQHLLQAIAQTQLHTFLFQGYEAKRKVANFGYDWSFEKRTLSKGKAIPAEFDSLLQKVAHHLSIAKEAFAELLITEYPLGSVINWHRDAPPFDSIAGISLISDCTFKLRPHDIAKQNRNAIISFPVQQRSLIYYARIGKKRLATQHCSGKTKALFYHLANIKAVV